MIRTLRGLAHKYFSDEEAVILFLILVTGTIFVIWFGAMLAPAIASLIIAFILQGLENEGDDQGGNGRCKHGTEPDNEDGPRYQYQEQDDRFFIREVFMCETA